MTVSSAAAIALKKISSFFSRKFEKLQSFSASNAAQKSAVKASENQIIRILYRKFTVVKMPVFRKVKRQLR